MISSQRNLRTTYIFGFWLIVARRINWYAFISSILLHCNATTCESSLTTTSTASVAAKFVNESLFMIIVTLYVEFDEYFSSARYTLHIYIENFKSQFRDPSVRLSYVWDVFCTRAKGQKFLNSIGKRV